MRSARLLFILVIAVYAVPGDSQKERCPPENCLAENKCETQLFSAECENSMDTCCSIVKSEFRTACRHHGGECRDACASALQRSVNDCDPGDVCCVLV